ncbi:MAG: hypothetical protein H6737_19765 [Alphaproteobacteria bacterium]|nr:hypothetical protein [Alphaproteobacteria bacterium]
MNRLHRRTVILRGKRDGAFDPNQYYFEKAERTRLARSIRVSLRFGRPVVLIAPRWSQADRFLDDLSVDLSLGDPSITARTLSLAPLKGLTVHQGWGWLASAVAEFCQIHLEEGPAWQAVSRRGFREVMADMLDRAEGGRRRCLLLHHVEHVPVDALHDLLDVFRAHREKHKDDLRFNLLVAGSVDAPHLQFPGAARFDLADFSPIEAIEALVEHLGPVEAEQLRQVVTILGGVPALLDAVGEGSDLAFLRDRQELWKALGPVAKEVRSALEIVNADPRLSARLERLARQGRLPEEPEHDFLLQRAGLVRSATNRRGDVFTVLRTPWFSELALAG